MKKFTMVILVFVLTLSLLAGCRGNGGNDTSAPQESQNSATRNGGMDDGIMDDGIMDDFDNNGDVTDGNGVIGDNENIGRSGNGPMHR